MNTTLIDAEAIVCDFTAIPAPAREEHILTAARIFRAVQEVRGLPGGYAFRLANEPEMFMALARFVENERRCCPFYDFGLEIEPNAGPLWLRLTGSAGVKELLRAALYEQVDPAVLKRLIHTGADGQLDDLIAQTLPVMGDFTKTPWLD